MTNQENNKITEIGSLGKQALIQRLTQDFGTCNKSTSVGLSDDAAAIGAGAESTAVGTAIMVEGIHFDMTYTPLQHLGYKAVALAMAKVVAMNALPQQVMVQLAVSSRYSVEALEELFAGIRRICQRYDTDLVGCDITSSMSGLTIGTTAIGTAEKCQITGCGGAQVHDLLCASGDFGSAYAGLLILEREKATFKANPNFQPDFASHEYVLERFLKPEPRTDIVKWLADNDIVPTAMTNVADGLADAAMRLCHLSHCGCEIYEERIPIDYGTSHVCSDFGTNMLPVSLALNGGMDNELLFSIKQSDYEKVKDCPNVAIVGHITEQNRGAIMVTPQNTAIELTSQSWNPAK
ncbi:MAG: thiamine-phosphate kinase [Bacteroidales bacterium]|nr:thiamine-phosphate kinase [Bacteroidales bacterium]